ncbi:hypothetical protein [Anaeromicropila populeti]|uniref:PrgI family protein n=1 Tax=Anaeromicropila populeti TaxID=37658 RepID=A0A1I6JF84_9FIRM|nr:hypothetical protein [Anaeromicropila populeti]SFR77637.1 hypothetical protein SAMN05661086_01634 [Anaeromicropila populeti]
MKEQKEALYMPQGLKKRREYFDGYGQKEFGITLISVLIAVLFSFLAYGLSGNRVGAIFLVLAIPAGTILSITKDGSNISITDQIRFMVEFRKSQKKYRYIARNEWE